MIYWNLVFWFYLLRSHLRVVSISYFGTMLEWRKLNVSKIQHLMNTVQKRFINIFQSNEYFVLERIVLKKIFFLCFSLFESLQTLFWGTFGLIDLQTFQIYKKHTFTMFIGLLMYGVYSSIMIIVLLNMLIAMMSNSYQYIAVCDSLFSFLMHRKSI